MPETAAFERFENCKYSDGHSCYYSPKGVVGKILEKIFGTPSHNVGDNGYSIKCHCGGCERFEEGDLSA